MGGMGMICNPHKGYLSQRALSRYESVLQELQNLASAGFAFGICQCRLNSGASAYRSFASPLIRESALAHCGRNFIDCFHFGVMFGAGAGTCLGSNLVAGNPPKRRFCKWCLLPNPSRALPKFITDMKPVAACGRLARLSFAALDARWRGARRVGKRLCRLSNRRARAFVGEPAECRRRRDRSRSQLARNGTVTGGAGIALLTGLTGLFWLQRLPSAGRAQRAR